MEEEFKTINKEVAETILEPSENKIKKSKAIPKKPEPIKLKPYIHINTFMQTAVPLFKLNNMQAAGFHARMNGRHYQRDEQVFVEELKKYLNLK